MKNIWKGFIVFIALILVGSLIFTYLFKTPIKEESASHCTSVTGREKGDIVLDILLNKDFEEYSKICMNSEIDICNQNFFENKRNALSGLNFSYEGAGIVYGLNEGVIYSVQNKTIRIRYVSEDRGFNIYLDIGLAYNNCDLIDINVYTKKGDLRVDYPEE